MSDEVIDTGEIEEVIESDEPLQELEEVIEPPDTTPYTPEEMKLLTIENVDPERVPPDLRPWFNSLHKNLVSDYTKKTMTLAEERRAIQQAKPVEPAKPAEPATLYDAFRRDPKKVTSTIDAEIENLVDENPADPKIRKLEKLKSDLILQRQLDMEDSLLNKDEVNEIRNQAVSMLAKEVPNFTAKLPKLTKFLGDTLGDSALTREELNIITDPRIVGVPASVKFVKLVNLLYDRLHPADALKDKEARSRDLNLEKSGGSSSKSTKKPVKDLSDKEFEDMRASILAQQ